MLRIQLETVTFNDLDTIVDIKSDLSLWEYEYDAIGDRNTWREIMEERLKDDRYFQYFIRLNDETKALVGELHIHLFEDDRNSWEVGYCVLPEFRKRGYCVEAVKIALKYAFSEWSAHKVVAFCNEHNIGSYKVMEKAGMKRDGILREELPWNNGWVDQYIYSILHYEFHL